MFCTQKWGRQLQRSATEARPRSQGVSLPTLRRHNLGSHGACSASTKNKPHSHNVHFQCSFGGPSVNGNKVEPCMRPRLASISKTPWEAWARSRASCGVRQPAHMRLEVALQSNGNVQQALRASHHIQERPADALHCEALGCVPPGLRSKILRMHSQERYQSFRLNALGFLTATLQGTAVKSVTRSQLFVAQLLSGPASR